MYDQVKINKGNFGPYQGVMRGNGQDLFSPIVLSVHQFGNHRETIVDFQHPSINFNKGTYSLQLLQGEVAIAPTYVNGETKVRVMSVGGVPSDFYRELVGIGMNYVEAFKKMPNVRFSGFESIDIDTATPNLPKVKTGLDLGSIVKRMEE